eukprot:UN30985
MNINVTEERKNVEINEMREINERLSNQLSETTQNYEKLKSENETLKSKQHSIMDKIVLLEDENNVNIEKLVVNKNELEKTKQRNSFLSQQRDSTKRNFKKSKGELSNLNEKYTDLQQDRDLLNKKIEI